MKNLNSLVALLLLATITLVGCSKNDDVTIIDDGQVPPTPFMYADLKKLADELVNLTSVFNAEDGITFTSPKGVNFTLPPNSLTLNGSPITGEVELQYKEIFDRGTMLATNRTTMGKRPDGDKALLISGGEIYVNATQNGQQLALNNNIIAILPAALTGGGDPNMTLWKGRVDENDNLTWDEIDPVAQEGQVFLEGNGADQSYYAYFNTFGWTNVDRFYSDPRPKTTLLVDVPEGYDNQNSAVYLSYDGEGNSALANLDTYNASTGMFSEHYGQIPIGLEMHIIFATEDNGQWRYAIQGVTVVDNAVYTFTLAETTLGTLEQMIAAINNLP